MMAPSDLLARAHVEYQAVCPKAPPGMTPFKDDVMGWTAWGVLALIGIAGLVSIGAIVMGRIFAHPHASRAGAVGLAVIVVAAILYVTIGGVLDGITGSGCV